MIPISPNIVQRLCLLCDLPICRGQHVNAVDNDRPDLGIAHYDCAKSPICQPFVFTPGILAPAVWVGSVVLTQRCDPATRETDAGSIGDLEVLEADADGAATLARIWPARSLSGYREVRNPRYLRRQPAPGAIRRRGVPGER